MLRKKNTEAILLTFSNKIIFWRDINHSWQYFVLNCTRMKEAFSLNWLNILLIIN